MQKVLLMHLNQYDSDGNNRVFTEINGISDIHITILNEERTGGIKVTDCYFCEINCRLEDCPEEIMTAIVLCRIYPYAGDGWKIIDRIKVA